MGFTFVPEYYFKKFNDADVAFLKSLGVKGIILDVDNTLEPYEHPLPGDEVKNWINELRLAGISAAIVSNNDAKRIDLFNKELGLFALTKAGKPKKKSILLAMEAMHTDCNNTILMGDQIFTDVWAAHNAGIKAILVSPINDRKDVLTKFKRVLEKPVLRKYKRRLKRKEKK